MSSPAAMPFDPHSGSIVERALFNYRRVVVALCLRARRVRVRGARCCWASAPGSCSAIQAASSKSVLTIGTSGGVQLRAMATSWELYALLLMAVASVALQ